MFASLQLLQTTPDLVEKEKSLSSVPSSVFMYCDSHSTLNVTLFFPLPFQQPHNPPVQLLLVCYALVNVWKQRLLVLTTLISCQAEQALQVLAGQPGVGMFL